MSTAPPVPAGKPRPVLLALAVAVTVVVVVSPLLGPEPSVEDLVFSALFGGTFLSVGCVVLLRAGWHRIGWLLVVTGIAFAIGTSATNPFLPRWSVDWMASWSFTVAFACLAYTTLVFPSGRLSSRTEASAKTARAMAAALAVFVLLTAFVRVPDGSEAGVVVPFGFLPTWVGTVATVGSVLVLLGGAASLIARFRRSAGEMRAQLAWVISSLTLVAVSIAATVAYLVLAQLLGRPDPREDVWTVVAVAVLALPLAFMVAILRYRLYEIDRLISRTVTYALVVGVLAAVYAGGVFLLSSLLPLQSDLAVAASTLAAAALFHPLRRRLRQNVDRRFNRRRYDAVHTVEAFNARLRDELDLDALGSELVGVAARTMEPAALSLWLRRTGAQQ